VPESARQAHLTPFSSPIFRDAIIKNLGLPKYIEQETDEQLKEHGDSPIESLLDGKSALDAIMGTA
jgi:hypothetical protein